MPKSLNLNQNYRMTKLISLLKQNRYPNASSFADLLSRELKEANHNIQMSDPKRENYDREAFKIIKQNLPVTETYLANFTTKKVNTVSTRTIMRDIDILRKVYSAPIEFDHLRNGYTLTDPDYSPNIQSFSKSDVSTTVIAMRTLERMMPEGTQIKEKLSDSINEIVAESPKSNCSAVPKSLMIFNNAETVDADIFDEVYLAWSTCTTMTISSNDESISDAKFEAHVIALKDGRYYMRGKLYKHDACEVKTLKISEMSEAVADGAKFIQDLALIDETAHNGI